MNALAEGLRRYLSAPSLARLGSARVGIAGAGGLGSNVAMLLVRSGIQNLVVVDHDRVDASNLNRQCYWPEDVGSFKVEALHRRLLTLEPSLICSTRAETVTPATACAIFAGCDAVVEALDEAESKASLCQALLAQTFFVVGASGIGGYGLPPLTVRRVGASFVCVGDFQSAVGDSLPPLAPRVMQAAALQADAVITHLLA